VWVGGVGGGLGCLFGGGFLGGGLVGFGVVGGVWVVGGFLWFCGGGGGGGFVFFWFGGVSCQVLGDQDLWNPGLRRDDGRVKTS